MTQKIAVIVIHGIGRQTTDFADRLKDRLQELCRPACGDDVVIEAAYWAPIMQSAEDRLWDRAQEGGPMRYQPARRLLVDFLGDALAYQIVPGDRRAYDAIHAEIARTIHRLADQAGPAAPLIVVAHSLGSIIASNYIYDQQADPIKGLVPAEVQAELRDSPLERGETLTALYTLGSPIALWSLRYREFGQPIQVPSPALNQHYRFLPGEWINFYDRDDVVAFPLKSLNDAYEQAVTEDHELNAGALLDSWNPLSHLAYWHDEDVVRPIARSLIATWRYVNAEQ